MIVIIYVDREFLRKDEGCQYQVVSETSWMPETPGSDHLLYLTDGVDIFRLQGSHIYDTREITL
jgi:hypothetical protein